MVAKCKKIESNCKLLHFFIVLRRPPCYNLYMNSVNYRSPAKVNFTLDIKGVHGGYHMLESLACTVSVCDEISVLARSDDKVTVEMHSEGCEGLPPWQNNAYAAAVRFVDTFRTRGADIVIRKGIPCGAGLGGSSADAAGVLRALSLLYGVGEEGKLAELAAGLGSDTRYMLGGGWAVMRGRGEKVSFLLSPLRLWLVILVPPVGVSAAACYAEYDKLPRSCVFSSVPPEELAKDGALLCKSLHNDLFAAASRLNPAVEEAFKEALALSPDGACMSGSGSAVFAAFKDEERAFRAYNSYSGKFRAILAHTL